jgi:peptidoglycan/LPS O-acetylase OafA/YrhL
MSTWDPPTTARAARAQVSQLPYVPGLDGLRALAVGAVMVYHAHHTWLSGGFLGVEVFFVISGYLITLLMIGEHERSGRVSLKQFWKRRARRLLPALFVLLGGLGLYLAFFYRRPQGRTRGDFLGGIFYGSNWYQIVVGQSYTASEAFAPLRHLWSLAVEEQFYLIWPLVMVFLLRKGRDRLPRVGVRLIAISLAITVAVAVLFVSGDVPDECGTGAIPRGYASVFGRCININDTLYLSTFSRAGGLLLGAGFAMLWRPLALLRGPLRTKGHQLDLVALAGLLGLAALAYKLEVSESGNSFGSRYDPWLYRGGFFLTGLATLAIIAAVVHRRAWTGRIIGNPLFAWIGTRSYGLYLFHWPIYQIIRKAAGVEMTWKQFAVAMALTIPVTELSYRFVETPIRSGRLRRWLRGEQRIRTGGESRNRRKLVIAVATVSSIFGFTSVSLAVARNVCVGDVECSIEEQNAAEAAAAASPPTTVRVATTPPHTRGSMPDNAAPTTEFDDTPTTESTGETDVSVTTIADAAATTVAGDPTTTAVAIDPSGSTPVASLATDPPVDTAAVVTEPPSTAPPVTAAATTAPPPTAAPETGPPATNADGSPVTTTTAPPPPPTPATLSDGGVQPVALGESVMLGAVNQLQAGGFFVDALKGRQGPEMATLVENMRAAGQLGKIVVIQIGTNGSVSADDFARMMAQLTPDQTPLVVFMTVRVPKKWQDGNNTLIRDLPNHYSNVRILDWQVASMSINICKDGTHIACGNDMAQYYTNQIFEAIGHPELEKPVPSG